jgi:hypothetical protein
MFLAFLGAGDQFQHPFIEANGTFQIDTPLVQVDHQAGQFHVLEARLDG